MLSYRLKPRLPVWRIAGVCAALMFAPYLLSLSMPQLADARSTVTLGKTEYDWSVPIHWPDGSELVCEDIGDVMFPIWDCEGTKVHTLIMEDSEDAENTLRRAMRALLVVPPSEGEFVRDGDILLYETAEGIGISKQDEELTIVAVVEGEEQRPYSDLILLELRGGTGELPYLSELGATA